MTRASCTGILALALAMSGCSTLQRTYEPAPAASLPSPAGLASNGSIQPQDEAALFMNVIGGLESQQRYDAALAFLDSYALKQRELVPRYWLLRGNALLGAGRKAEAVLAYAQLDATPLVAEGSNGKGRVAAASLQWRDAQAFFQKAVLMLPSSADFLNNLAYADMQLGLSAQSVNHLRAAHELAPASDLIRNNYIIALMRAGDLDGANQLLAAVKNAPERDAIQRRAQIISQGKAS